MNQDEIDQHLKATYLSGKNTAEAGAPFLLTKEQTRHRLKRLGVKLRSTSEAMRIEALKRYAKPNTERTLSCPTPN